MPCPAGQRAWSIPSARSKTYSSGCWDTLADARPSSSTTEELWSPVRWHPSTKPALELAADGLGVKHRREVPVIRRALGST